MSYVSELSDAIRAEAPPELLPDQDVDLLFLMYAVLLLAKGPSVDAEDVHNAWAAWMTHRGVAHESLVPFRDLESPRFL